MRIAVQLAVAASGGADSTALLLHAAWTLPPDRVVVVTVDHRTRPNASAAERQAAAAMAARLGIACHSLTVSPNGHGHAHWREARLEALIGFCRDRRIPCLWLGQHADDAIETAAIRLLAEGPLEGLAGMTGDRVVDGVRIQRPLLSQSARGLRRSLMAAGMGWAEDPSNRNLAYKRAVVRSVLAALPRERADNADRVDRIAHWRAEREQLEAEAWRVVTRPSMLGAVVLEAALIQRLPGALRARLLRRAARQVAGSDDRIRHVDFAAAARSGPPVVLGGAVLVAEQGAWWVTRRPESIAGPEALCDNMMWDRRCRLVLTAPLPPGTWAVEAVRGRRIGAMNEMAPAAVLDGLPAIVANGRMAAIPHLHIWRGTWGKVWAAHLHWSWRPTVDNEIFRLVP